MAKAAAISEPINPPMPRLDFIYIHLNRVIKEHDLSVINITGPGHGGRAVR